MLAAVKAGAAGYLLKHAKPQELGDAIRAANRGEALVHPAVAARLMQEVAAREHTSPADSLTPRELEVLRLIARGLPNKQIARELQIADKTVKTHVSNILRKLDLQDRTQAVVYAVRERIVDID
jgi:NarL family two-component system response regulator LiaR